MNTGMTVFSQLASHLPIYEFRNCVDRYPADLCLSLFPWSRLNSGKKKGAIKLHTLLDLRGHIPSFIRLTDGTVHEVNILDEIIPEPGSFYLMDRGYYDFGRLYRIHSQGAYFVILAKSNLKFRRLYSHPIDKTTGLRCDQTIVLTGFYQKKDYPEKLRRIRYFDKESNKTLTFLTNNSTLPALTIAKLYKYRWQIELFFKWIKQNLRIKAFYGRSENAVKTQIWIAIPVYILIAIVKKRQNLEIKLYTFRQILSISVFEKVSILQLLTDDDYRIPQHQSPNQMNLFDL